MTNKPKIPATEKRMARNFHFLPMPFSITYIGPPWIFPDESLPRYMMAKEQVKYLVAIPTNADTHIQKIAPGPPMLMAKATPLMFPKPTVAATAEDKACREVMSPLASGSSYLPPTTFMAWRKPWKGIKPE